MGLITSTPPRVRTGTSSLPNRAIPYGGQHAPPPAPLSPTQRLAGMNPAQKAQFGQWLAGQSRNQALASVNTPTGATSLGGMQQAGYNAQANRAQETYQSAINDNQFKQGQLQNSYIPQFRDMATRQGLERTAQPDQFIARGALGGGLDIRNLTQLLTNQGRQHTDLVNAEAGGLSALKNARNQIEQNRASALASIQANRQAALGALAVKQIQ